MKRSRILAYILLFTILVFTTPLRAEIHLPRLISDGMVLQRNTPVKLWGWANNQENIEVHFKEKTYKTIADKNGNWQITLPAQPAGGPFEIKLIGTNTIVLHNVLFGDVWICSGQSNMELPMSRVSWEYPLEIKNCTNDKIRQFLVPDVYDFNKSHTDFTNSNWLAASPETIMDFTAVGYFFANELYQKYQVPIGLINSSLGGSPAEAWMSEEALHEFPQHLAIMQKFKDSAYIKQIESNDQLRINAWYKESTQKDAGYQTSGQVWTSATLDDKDWKTINVPELWKNNGLEGKHGVVWFRKKFTIESETNLADALLVLGRIVDADSVFVNGTFVGNTTYLYPPRRYQLPEGILQQGENTIVVRVINSSGIGGFFPDKDYEIQFTNDTLDLSGTWKYKIGTVMPSLDGQTFVRWQPGGLFNGMIAPLLNYTFKGVILYQGESNVGRSEEYQTLFPAMINDWRKHFNQGKFPFIFVQLANYLEANSQPTESDWALLRESQYKALEVPNTAMATIIDIGEWNDIHPLNKKDVGYRLALAAEHISYGEKNIVYSGPTYQSMQVEGSKIELRFDQIGSGLLAKNNDSLQQFAIAGANKKFVWAQAKIEGNKIIVWSHSIKNPVAVRYAWADNPEGANLYNKEGLPAVPFRTDSW